MKSFMLMPVFVLLLALPLVNAQVEVHQSQSQRLNINGQTMTISSNCVQIKCGYTIQLTDKGIKYIFASGLEVTHVIDHGYMIHFRNSTVQALENGTIIKVGENKSK